MATMPPRHGRGFTAAVVVLVALCVALAAAPIALADPSDPQCFVEELFAQDCYRNFMRGTSEYLVQQPPWLKPTKTDCCKIISTNCLCQMKMKMFALDNKMSTVKCIQDINILKCPKDYDPQRLHPQKKY
ncbi:hypothetical protein ACP70R_041420 [Stipagrostis hirtigluma subsp. patula]